MKRDVVQTVAATEKRKAGDKTLDQAVLEVLAVAVYLRDARDALEPYAGDNDSIKGALECVNRARLKLEELHQEMVRK